jgi:hypothetical protein
LAALQHVATIKDGQQLLLTNSIESLVADFFLGHGFMQGATVSAPSYLCTLAHVVAESSSTAFAPSVINQRSPVHTLIMCKLLSSLLPPIDVRQHP